jgi:ribosomal protein S18 acetylase RimI-like enzyme
MISISETTPEQAAALLALARVEPLFSPAEAAVVEELLQDYLDRPDHNGYFFLSALEGEALVGFACYGPTPMTQGTYDLYWIAVSGKRRGAGIGRALMDVVEANVRAAGGRLLVLDTSGREEYAGTRAFYERLGFEQTAEIPDFYAPGDDLVIYRLRMSDPQAS